MSAVATHPWLSPPAATESILPHGRLLRMFAFGLLLLNLADAALTLLAVQLGVATEANPLFARMVTDAPTTFLVVKVAMVTVGTGVLWRYRDRNLAAAGLVATFSAYVSVMCCFHLPGRPLLLQSLGR